ncbi:MAG: hypothetical protein LBG87_10225 [Spirochaetaceae bacterium]|nr:hypothetical protein [Spirochaetaceae bacterium]
MPDYSAETGLFSPSEAIKQVNLRGAGTINACGDEDLCAGYGFAHTGVSLVCETRSPSL